MARYLKDRATIRLARSIDGEVITTVALRTLLHAGKKAVEVKAARVSSILLGVPHTYCTHSKFDRG
jgi:hypothetical protein